MSKALSLFMAIISAVMGSLMLTVSLDSGLLFMIIALSYLNAYRIKSIKERID